MNLQMIATVATFIVGKSQLYLHLTEFVSLSIDIILYCYWLSATYRVTK
jgi:hypothetical protein